MAVVDRQKPSKTGPQNNHMKDRSIILIGAMGAGKSTIGRKLANMLEMPFYDSDRVIEKKTGVDIATIFEYEGEKGFRAREEKTIDELCQLEDIVLATGGGAVLSKSTRDLLSETGTVFYLKAPADVLFSRIRGDAKRPLLKTPEGERTVADLLRQREPFYLETADYTITTGRHTTDRIAGQIAAHMENV